MRHWTHDDLHEIMDDNSDLNLRSNLAHKLFDTDSTKSMRFAMLTMIKLHADAVRCPRFTEDAAPLINQAFDFIEHQVTSMEAWAALESEKKEGIRGILGLYETERRCGSPRGDDYTCYCDED